MSNGVLLFAHDNGLFPYSDLAVACAWFVKKHMPGTLIHLAGDADTLRSVERTLGFDILFDGVSEVNGETNTKRTYFPGSTGEKAAAFLNKSRSSAFDISPFDKTLILDLDFLVMDGMFNQVWDLDEPILMNYQVDNIHHGSNEPERWLNPDGIKQYWATVIRFDRTKESEQFFDLMEYVKRNYEHFSYLYGFSSRIYRNDFSASVAAHLMNAAQGVSGLSWPVGSLPDPKLLFAWGEQPLLNISEDQAWFAGKIGSNTREVCPAYIRQRSVHVMNKESLISVLIPWVRKQIEDGNV